MRQRFGNGFYAFHSDHLKTEDFVLKKRNNMESRVLNLESSLNQTNSVEAESRTPSRLQRGCDDVLSIDLDFWMDQSRTLLQFCWSKCGFFSGLFESTPTVHTHGGCVSREGFFSTINLISEAVNLTCSIVVLFDIDVQHKIWIKLARRFCIPDPSIPCTSLAHAS